MSPATHTTSSPPAGQGAAAQGVAATLVRVAAPGRLHLGFLDPSASLGRRFGSLGLVIDGPQTVLELGWAEPGATTDVCSAAPHLAPDHAAAELTRVRAHLAALRLALGASQRIWPALAVRVASRLFLTPLPLKLFNRGDCP